MNIFKRKKTPKLCYKVKAFIVILFISLLAYSGYYGESKVKQVLFGEKHQVSAAVGPVCDSPDISESEKGICDAKAFGGKYVPFFVTKIDKYPLPLVIQLIVQEAGSYASYILSPQLTECFDIDYDISTGTVGSLCMLLRNGVTQHSFVVESLDNLDDLNSSEMALNIMKSLVEGVLSGGIEGSVVRLFEEMTESEQDYLMDGIKSAFPVTSTSEQGYVNDIFNYLTTDHLVEDNLLFGLEAKFDCILDSEEADCVSGLTLDDARAITISTSESFNYNEKPFFIEAVLDGAMDDLVKTYSNWNNIVEGDFVSTERLHGFTNEVYARKGPGLEGSCMYGNGSSSTDECTSVHPFHANNTKDLRIARKAAIALEVGTLTYKNIKEEGVTVEKLQELIDVKTFLNSLPNSNEFLVTPQYAIQTMDSYIQDVLTNELSSLSASSCPEPEPPIECPEPEPPIVIVPNVGITGPVNNTNETLINNDSNVNISNSSNNSNVNNINIDGPVSHPTYYPIPPIPDLYSEQLNMMNNNYINKIQDNEDILEELRGKIDTLKELLAD